MKRIGIEIDGAQIRCATLRKQGPMLSTTLPKGPARSIAALEGGDVLIRSATIPSKNKRVIEKALPFQLERLVPGARDDKVILQRRLSSGKGVHIAFFVTPLAAVKLRIAQAKEHHCDPETITSTQTALCSFANRYLSSDKRILFLHIKEKRTTAVCIASKQVIYSHDIAFGFSHLVDALFLDRPSLSRDQVAYMVQKRPLSEVTDDELPHLATAIKQFKMEGTRLLRYLAEKGGKMVPEELIITGMGATLVDCALLFADHLPQTPFEDREKRLYAVPLGLVHEKAPLQFRQGELLHRSHKRRLSLRSTAAALLLLLLAGSLYVEGTALLKRKQAVIDQGIEAIWKEMPELQGVRDIPTLQQTLEHAWRSEMVHKEPVRVSDFLETLSSYNTTITHIEFSQAPHAHAAHVRAWGHGGDIKALKERFTVEETDEGYVLEGTYEK